LVKFLFFFSPSPKKKEGFFPVGRKKGTPGEDSLAEKSTPKGKKIGCMPTWGEKRESPLFKRGGGAQLFSKEGGNSPFRKKEEKASLAERSSFPLRRRKEILSSFLKNGTYITQRGGRVPDDLFKKKRRRQQSY